MKIDSKIIAALAVVSLILLATGDATAETPQIPNKTEKASPASNSAQIALLDAQNAMQEMADAGFNTTHVADILQSAIQLYDGQLSLEKQGKNATYGDIVKKADEIKGLRNLAFNINDRLSGLKISIEERHKSANMTEPENIYGEALVDFKSERYENAERKIELAYKRISELEVEKSRSGVIIEATKTLWQRIVYSWKQITIAAAAIAIALGIGYNKMYSELLKMRMQMLESERTTIEGLIKKVQDDYFTKGHLSETTYHIKLRKYGEELRDINRQVPLLREAIEKRKGIIK